MKKIYNQPIAQPLVEKLNAQLLAASPGSDGEFSDNGTDTGTNIGGSNTGSFEDGGEFCSKRRSLWDSDDE